MVPEDRARASPLSVFQIKVPGGSLHGKPEILRCRVPPTSPSHRTHILPLKAITHEIYWGGGAKTYLQFRIRAYYQTSTSIYRVSFDETLTSRDDVRHKRDY